MDNLIYIAGLAATFIIGLFLGKFLPSYISEKGKNLATKEDITQITGQVESVKLENNQKLEELKTALTQQSHLVTKKREIYEELVKSLRVFIRGGNTLVLCNLSFCNDILVMTI